MIYRATISHAGMSEGGILGDVAADDGEAESAMRSAMDQNRTEPAFDGPSGGATSPVRVLKLPLARDQTIEMRFPWVVSQADFDMVLTCLKLWERNIVARPPAEPAATAV